MRHAWSNITAWPYMMYSSTCNTTRRVQAATPSSSLSSSYISSVEYPLPYAYYWPYIHVMHITVGATRKTRRCVHTSTCEFHTFYTLLRVYIVCLVCHQLRINIHHNATAMLALNKAILHIICETAKAMRNKFVFHNWWCCFEG